MPPPTGVNDADEFVLVKAYLNALGVSIAHQGTLMPHLARWSSGRRLNSLFVFLYLDREA